MKNIRTLPYLIKGCVVFVMAMVLALTNGCRSEKAFSEFETNSILTVKNKQSFLAGLNKGTNLTIEAELFIDGKQVEDPSWMAFSEDKLIAKVDNTLNVTAISSGETYLNIKYDNLTVRFKVVVTDAHIKSLQITPSSITLIHGHTATLESSAILSNGRTIALDNDLVTWASSEPELATVDHQGMIQALNVGQVTVAATLISNSSVTGTSSVTVSEAIIESIQITPMNFSLIDGYTHPLTVSAVLSNGQTINLNNKLVTWESLDTEVATVNEHGVVKGQHIGSTKVIATLINEPSITSESTVTVSEAIVESLQVIPSTISLIDGHTATLSAAATLSNGLTIPLENNLVTWVSSDVTTATINNKGVVEGQNLGISTVKATLRSDSSITGTSSITVSEAVVESIHVTPSTLSLIDGHSATLEASASLSDGRTMTLHNNLITWTSSDVSIASVNDQGVVKGLNTGSTKITATLISNSSITGTSSLTVTEAVVESIEVTPSPLSLSIGDTETLSISATLSDGRVTTLDNSILTWSSADSEIARINSAGEVKAQAYGSTNISVTYPGLPTINVKVNVLQNIKKLSLNPERVLVKTGSEFQLEVKAILDDNSLVVLDNNLITWHVADSSVALVNSDGMVQGISDGSTQITATYLYFSETSDVIVSSLSKETQSSVDIAVGVPFQWRAIYTNTNGDRVDVTNQSSWSIYEDSNNGEKKVNELVRLGDKGQYQVNKLGSNYGYAGDIFYTYNGDVTRVAVNSYSSHLIKSMPHCSTKRSGELGMCTTQPIGGDGGNPKPIASCPLGSVATGLVFKYSTTSVWGGLGIQLKCSSVSLDINNQLIFEDNDKESELVHGDDHPLGTTDTYTSQCSVGSIISSIRTTSNSYGILDNFKLGCSPLSYDTYNSRYIVDKSAEQQLPWLRSSTLTEVQVSDFMNNVGLSAIAVRAGAALDSTVFIANEIGMSVAPLYHLQP